MIVINQLVFVEQPKSISLKYITVTNLKFRPIINQTGIPTYNAAKVISDYMRLLCRNEYSIDDTQKFQNMLFSIPSLLANIPIEETMK